MTETITLAFELQPMATCRLMDWVRMWRLRNGQWESFKGRVLAPHQIQYMDGTHASPHDPAFLNVATHWSPLFPSEIATGVAVEQPEGEFPVSGRAGL